MAAVSATGNRLLMTVGTTRGSRVVVVDLRDGKKSPVTDVTDVAVARYLPTGTPASSPSRSALQVVPFDVTDGSVRGAPVTVVEGRHRRLRPGGVLLRGLRLG